MPINVVQNDDYFFLNFLAWIHMTNGWFSLISVANIFEEHDLVDVIRQLDIDFENDPDEERIKDFFYIFPKLSW